MKTKIKILCLALCAFCGAAFAIDNLRITGKHLAPGRFTLVKGGRPRCAIRVETDETAVKIAADNLAKDFERVTGAKVPEKSDLNIVVRIDPSMGKRETYRITFTETELVITGSDRRGAVYGIYEISEQIGVSPWYDWADAPLPKHETLAMVRGEYTNGEPAVRYRGIFLNDEAPCLTLWVKNTYGTGYGDHNFYARVGELILRLRGNFLWPAMWSWAFYADDPANSKTLSEMGVIVGTSHHEPMGRNHQEWARKRKEYGAWNYQTNKDTLDNFFAEGVRRLKDTEDVVTIGMRGDGDKAMDGAGNLELMRTIIANQRAIIERETGKSASETPQVWALYKEVQDDYDRGLRPPEDVTILLCDDNWGNIRRLPGESERAWPGGWGMYYHVDYVGAPRNSKFINCTSAMSMWEQMSLAYEYGVDRLWILNVGDLKPMEYPISLFLDMAWDPKRYTPATLHDFTVKFCSRFFGGGKGKEAARILDATSRFANRCTPEMLCKNTYDLASGEWSRAVAEYTKLAEDARKQYKTLPPIMRDVYFELILFPVEVMANLYEMYYAQAMNEFAASSLHSAAEETKETTQEAKLQTANCKLQTINYWADRVEAAFARHAELCDAYNLKVAGGKWNGMMRQKVIGYTSWSDGFPADTCPKVIRVGDAAEAQRKAEEAAALLARKEPRVYSNPRNKSSDKELGEGWWMRRHEECMERIKAQKIFDLVLVGDSLAHRWERQGAAAYASITNKLKVLNLGFGGDSVKNCLWRLRSGELDGYSAKVVQLMIGTNNNPNESAQETAAQIRACLREIREKLPSAKILLCAILPRGAPDCVERGHNHEVNALIKPLADGKTIFWTDYSDIFTLPDGRMNSALTDDGIHPNAAGYAAWAKVALPKWRQNNSLTQRRREAEGAEKILSAPSAAAISGLPSEIVIETKDCKKAVAPDGMRWEFLPGLGRGAGAMEVFPRLGSPRGARLEYNIDIPDGVKEIDVTVVTRSSLAFARPEGHRYTVGFAGGEAKEINFNGNLNEDPKNCYSVFYPTVARRIVEKKAHFTVPDGKKTLVLSPLEPGIAFEQIKIAWKGTEVAALSAPPLCKGLPFKLGVAVGNAQIRGKRPDEAALIARHFNSVTAENAMKAKYLQPKEGVFDFELADKFVDTALANGQQVIGHTLVWHSQHPDWLFADNPSRDTLIKRMETHIKTVVGHFKGRVSGWDVVNEALNDNGAMRYSEWQRIIGDDYVELAFRFAHEADPDAELYYNDYGLSKKAKRDGAVRLVRALKAAGCRIDAVGMQSHITLKEPKISDYEESIAAFAAEGVGVAATELDVSVLPSAWSLTADVSAKIGYDAKYNPWPDDCPPEIEGKLVSRYREVLAVLARHSAHVPRVTIWGLSDADSWLNDFPVKGRVDYPLLFDRSLRLKATAKSLFDF